MKNKNQNIANPHDKFFRETWSNPDNTRSFLQNFLPEEILSLIDLSSIEICKDSFIEKELADYYSDMLYKVMLSGTEGYVYVLFEHKSYYDRYIHLQLLEYMVKIWRLFIKQHKLKRKNKALPIVIPILICHGKRPWPVENTNFSSMFDLPSKRLSMYIPEFNLDLYDLTNFTDQEIRGTVMTRVVLLLLKHAFDPDLLDKLPDILILMRELMEKETGLQYFETVLRYLFNTMDDISTETIKEIAESAISKKAGEYIMTLAEKLRREGEIKGKIKGEIKGEIRGLSDAIELGMTLKFPDKIDEVMAEIKAINDIKILKKIKEAIKTAGNASEILFMIQHVKGKNKK